MYTVYILLSLKDHRTYVGYTNNLPRRLSEHNTGRSTATKYRAPFSVLHTEEYEFIEEAKAHELWWKGSLGRKQLRILFQNPYLIKSLRDD